ncbi:MAG: DUF2975 domain-containing protein [Balneola sp.]
MNRLLIKSLIALCWIGIATLAVYYIFATLTPHQQTISIGSERVKIPKIDPLVYLDTRSYALPQQMYNPHNRNIHPNEYLVEKSRSYYSGVGTKYYANAFYRADFRGFPVETILIYFFRVVTFLAVVLILYMLSKLLSSLLEDKAFDAINKSRIFWIGLLLIFISIIRVLHSTVLAAFLKYDTKLLGYIVEPSFQALWLIAVGILVFIFSAVYNQLIYLYEEQKLTV